MNEFKIPFFKSALKVVYSKKGVTEMSYIKSAKALSRSLNKSEKNIEKQIVNFLDGKETKINLPIDWKNLKGTEFQKKVWKKMTKVSFGKTVSYGDLAQSVNSPKGARAVGTACAKNPILLMIPCHRIVGGKSLGGFSGGGLSVKRKLLKLEESHFS